ncbi:MAG: TorD/DmsD family molecular chaperone [Planctomycetota bacterium]|jgi:TorA maturation chaperone TorD
MSTESVLPDTSDATTDKERMYQYRIFAAAFSYPDNSFFGYFPDLLDDKQSLMAEYDRLFRAGVVWLYGAEHLVENEFQRASILSDIMGFYTAFGLEPDKERPDSITCELEFMYGLIFKSDRINQCLITDNAGEKKDVCRDAEKKFFTEHLEPAANLIAKKIISESNNPFYKRSAKELLAFLRSEKRHFKIVTVKNGKQNKADNSSEKITKEEIVDEQ